MSSRRLRVWFAIAVFAMALPGTADAYIHLGFDTGGQTRAIKWTASRARWWANTGGVPGVSAVQFQSELAQAFMTWENVPTASIAFEFAGFTAAAPFEDDDLSVLGFESEPDMDRVLGATSFIVDVFSGTIIESDVFFNSIFPWSVSATGDPNRFDLRSVATHEIGHFLGLGHSAIGETEMRPDGGRRVLGSGAVMFPISLGRGVVADRVLQPDDIAGVSDLYPDGGFRDDTGIVAGRVRVDNAPVKGAHVVAFNPQTGALVGNFSAGGQLVSDRRSQPRAIRDSRRANRRCGYRQLPGSAGRQRELPGHVSSTAHRCAQRRLHRQLRRYGAGEMNFRRLIWVAFVMALGVGRAEAQTASQPAGRLEVSVGAGWLGGASFGEQPADLRGASGSPYRLFESETSLRGTGLFEARAGFALTRRYTIEGRAAMSKPELQTVVSSDAEVAGSFTAVESIDQVHVRRRRARAP